MLSESDQKILKDCNTMPVESGLKSKGWNQKCKKVHTWNWFVEPDLSPSLKSWNVIILWWVSQFSITPCQQIMIGNITQPFHTNDFSYISMFWEKNVKICKFLLFGRSTNPEESCKVQFEGNLEAISRIYKGTAAFPSPNTAFNHIVATS